MLRDILTNKWIVGGSVLIVIVAVSCYLWYQYDLSPYKKEAANTDELVKQLETTENTDSNNLTENKTETSEDTNAEESVSDADIEKFLKELVADGKISETEVEKLLKDVATEEAEEPEGSLSAEEIAERENKRKARDVWTKMRKIIQNAGGGIHSSTHPEEMQEIIALIEEAAGGRTVLTEMMDLSMMFQDSVDANGNIQVSELKRMVEYYETEFQSVDPEFTAFIQGSTAGIRSLALYAEIKGLEEVNLLMLNTHQDDIENVLTAHYESQQNENQ